MDVKFFNAMVAMAKENVRQEHAEKIAALPRFRIVFGQRWDFYPDSYSFGVMWDKDPCPDEGSWIYRRRIILHMSFRLWLERN